MAGSNNRGVPPESELHRHIYERSRGLRAGAGYEALLGPGDDCALIRSPAGDGLLLTVDQLVEGRHYQPGTDLDLIARKAIARSVSDIAAMGGSPAFALATALLPSGYAHADELFDAMARWALHWGCPLVGGDIATGPGPLSLTVTIAGRAGERVLTRSGASPGEAVYVSGRVGGSYESGRHLTFEPRLALGRFLNTHAPTETDRRAPDPAFRVSACLDVSDGVGRDAARIAEASGVRIELDASALPLHDGCTWQQGLGDGEDYELLFTASGPVPSETEGVSLTRIGRVTKAAGCVVITPEGDELDASESGWDHA